MTKVNKKTGEIIPDGMDAVQVRGFIADYKVKGHKLILVGVGLSGDEFKMVESCIAEKPADGERVTVTIRKEQLGLPVGK